MTKQSISKRDDFPPRVKLELAKRVNFRCSICDNHTVGPKTGSDKAISLGEAAHIKAAAPGGPRYDPNQTREERRSILNGIWACTHCATLIDRDDSAYSVEELLRYKRNAENRAQERLRRRPAEQAFASKSHSQIKRAVELYCLAEEERLEQLDSRFSASVSWGADGPVHEMRAREPVSPRITVNGGDRQAIVTALREVMEYGGARSFENVDIRLEGSPVFEEVDGPVKRFAISSEIRRSTLSVTFGSASESPAIVDFVGEATGGAAGFRVSGTAYDGLLSAELRYSNQTRDIDFKLHFGFERWGGKPLLRLPHFSKLVRFSKALETSTKLKLALTTDEELEIGAGEFDAGESQSLLHAFFGELQILRTVDAFFGLNLLMPADVDDVLRGAGDSDEMLALINIHESDTREVSMTLVPSEEYRALVEAVQDRSPGAARVEQKVEMNIFGQHFGPYHVEVECPNAVVLPVGPVLIKPDVPIQIRMQAIEGSHWTARKGQGIGG
jgi:hypothetical protein